jgi:hypothetical protein
MKSMNSLKTNISEVIDALSGLMNDERTQTASEFLQIITKVNKLISYFSDYT